MPDCCSFAGRIVGWVGVRLIGRNSGRVRDSSVRFLSRADHDDSYYRLVE
jgi:hypothetical protein